MSTNVYTVEIDGQQVDIEGDRPPSEAEARQALAAYQPSQESSPLVRFAQPFMDTARAAVQLGKRALTPPPTTLEGIKADPTALLNIVPGGAATADIVRGAAGAQMAEADKVQPLVDQGRYSEALGHGAAAMLPIVGPAAADIGETAAEGNIAGAAGKGVLLAAPYVKSPIKPTAVARLLKTQAAARILDAMRPTRGAVRTAENIAEDVAMGVPGREAAGGIGVGTRQTLAKRAMARAGAAGKEVEALQALDTPVDARSIPDELRARAAKLETRPPDRVAYEEVPTGILDENGQPIMGVQERNVPGKPVSGYPAKVSALRAQANEADSLIGQYDGGQVPAGELFKRRAAVGEKSAKGYGVMPGQKPSPAMQAGKAETGMLTDLLHEEIPASRIPDREYRVWQNAATNFERSRLSALTERGWRGLRDLLVGRAAGVALGAGVGSMGFGPLGGVVGAVSGAALGESAFWQTLRASTYAKLSKLLNAGSVDAAADVLTKEAASYAVSKGINDRTLNKRAQDALKAQAQGVVVP